MAKLVDSADVLNRLAGIRGVEVPKSVTEPRLQGYIEEASGIVLQKAGIDAADVPAKGTEQRGVLDGLVIRLAVLAILGDLFGSDAEMREANRRERNDLLEEAEELVVEGSPDTSQTFFEVI